MIVVAYGPAFHNGGNGLQVSNIAWLHYPAHTLVEIASRFHRVEVVNLRVNHRLVSDADSLPIESIPVNGCIFRQFAIVVGTLQQLVAVGVTVESCQRSFQRLLRDQRGYALPQVGFDKELQFVVLAAVQRIIDFASVHYAAKLRFFQQIGKKQDNYLLNKHKFSNFADVNDHKRKRKRQCIEYSSPSSICSRYYQCECITLYPTCSTCCSIMSLGIVYVW